MLIPYTAEKINNEVWCRLGVSKISGVGVIAIRDIPKDTVIHFGWRLGPDDRLILSEEEWKKIHPAIKDIILDRNCYLKDFDIIEYSIDHPNRHQEFINFMNYSKTPNSNGYCTNKEIKKGEEITEDYKTNNYETLDHMHKKGIHI